jgi:sec-independent protein translocase protein TatA
MKLIGAGIFGMGTPELLVILAIAIVLIGPTQLPKLGKMFGKTMKEVRSGIEDATQEVNADSAKEDAGCASCGAELASDSKFCNECGAQQEKAADA